VARTAGGACNIWTGRSQSKRLLGRSRHRAKNNIEIVRNLSCVNRNCDKAQASGFQNARNFSAEGPAPCATSATSRWLLFAPSVEHLLLHPILSAAFFCVAYMPLSPFIPITSFHRPLYCNSHLMHLIRAISVF
jgi:hypothetical protein